ncbi:hypothetical protein GCM10028808_75070 [Spirosoma migulaei]
MKPQEQIMSFVMASNEQESTANQVITIPSTAMTNRKLRMRVILNCGNVTPTACQLPGAPPRGSGEVEDYGIMIQAPSCMTSKEGLWNDANIWSCGCIPTSLDAVHIKHTVTIPEYYQAEASHLGYELSGQLIYTNSARLVLSNE